VQLVPLKASWANQELMSLLIVHSSADDIFLTQKTRAGPMVTPPLLMNVRPEQPKSSSMPCGTICARRNPSAGSAFRNRDSDEKNRISARRWNICDIPGKLCVASFAQGYFVRIEHHLSVLARVAH